MALLFVGNAEHRTPPRRPVVRSDDAPAFGTAAVFGGFGQPGIKIRAGARPSQKYQHHIIGASGDRSSDLILSCLKVRADA